MLNSVGRRNTCFGLVFLFHFAPIFAIPDLASFHLTTYEHMPYAFQFPAISTNIAEVEIYGMGSNTTIAY